MSVALITSIYGGYDTLKEPEPQEGVDEYVCVTDDPDLRSPTWSMIVEPRRGVHPCLAAKKPKMKPWLYSRSNNTVWIDASHRVTSPTFAREAVACLDENGIAQFKHPWRDCIYDESMACKDVPKYADLPIVHQAEHYRLWDHPEHWGLWETGVIARRWKPQLYALGAQWLRENETWTFQDQLSEAPLLRMAKLRPVEFPYHSRENPWFAYEPSAAH